MVWALPLDDFNDMCKSGTNYPLLRTINKAFGHSVRPYTRPKLPPPEPNEVYEPEIPEQPFPPILGATAVGSNEIDNLSNGGMCKKEFLEV